LNNVDFSKSINICENDSAYLGRGQVYLNEGKYDLAVTDYNKVLGKIAVIPDLKGNRDKVAKLSEVYYKRRFARLKIDRYEQGVEDMKIAARLGLKQAQDFLRSQRIRW
jgi:tetratricopeptide (TPR) repeat protein